MLLLGSSFTDSITFIVPYNVLLSAGDCPPTKFAQLTWPQALHYHHRGRGRGKAASHASLTQHLSETQFFTRQRGWGRARGRRGESREKPVRSKRWFGSHFLVLASLLPFHLPSFTLGGCRKYSGLQGDG